MKNFDIKQINKNSKFVLGEHTNESGPFDFDHFLVFIDSNGCFYECPIGNSEADEIIKKLEFLIGKKIKFKLCGITNFDSHILFPDSLKDDNFYFFKKRKLGIRGVLKLIVNFGISNTELHINKTILKYLDL